ncbi:MAG: trigger factor [Actinomycetota bacterium]|nr:trigger factor [Actinomycetota bacterium]MEC8504000.1 trigger factor [Actinomycetota bacterium]MEC8649028.1 trigger factor [Actinomycetota bacterium]MEC9213008.1 trigger factor [Actinomycetota bacterium]MEE3089527.1 trigger factor [Actinomycetota bacterium]
MKTDLESLSPTRVKLTVELLFDELQPSFDKAYASIAKQVSVPGFRKGKVPARVIEQRFGRGAVLEEAINDAVPKAYEDALREKEIVPVGRPEVDVTEIEDGEKVTFTAEVDVRPEFELPDYKAITVEVDAAEANDADIDEHIDNLRTRFASLKDVDRACADGDVLLVDIAGSTDSGDDVDDLSGNAMSYEMGTDGMLPGFDDAVRGASAGETRTFPFTPSNGDWAGVPLTVTATVTAVRERELPALDEEFVTMASEFDTVDELREDARTRVGRLKRMEQGQQAREKVNEALMASVDIPVPEGVIAAEVDAHFEDGDEASDEQRAEIEQQSREALKSQFILDRIAEVEEVSVGESELSNWLMQQAPRYGMAPDALAQALVESGQVSMALSDIRRSKALALVLENATVTDSNGDAVDLQALESELNEAMQAAQMAQLQAQMAAAESGQ